MPLWLCTQVTPCLFINKVDRLVLELCMTPTEAAQRLVDIVTHANMVVRMGGECGCLRRLYEGSRSCMDGVNRANMVVRLGR